MTSLGHFPKYLPDVIGWSIERRLADLFISL